MWGTFDAAQQAEFENDTPDLKRVAFDLRFAQSELKRVMQWLSQKFPGEFEKDLANGG